MSLATLKGALAPIHLWAPVHEIESVAIDQLKRVSALPCGLPTLPLWPISSKAQAYYSEDRCLAVKPIF